MAFLVAGAALAAALASYYLWERPGEGTWLPASLRGTGWVAIALLVLNPTIPIPGTAPRPLVLLDGSLSMAAAGGAWAEARSFAQTVGEVRVFGDPALALDSTPVAGRSLLAAALGVAGVSGRPVVVVTDGEIADRRDVPRDLLDGATIQVFPRSAGDAVALRNLQGPSRVVADDTVRITADFRSAGAVTGPVRVAVRLGGRELATASADIGAGTGSVQLAVPAARLGPGEHALEVALLEPADDETRDNSRRHIVAVTPAPGVVLVAAVAGWDARFLYQTLGDVTSLPVEGFVQLTPGSWQRMATLSPVSVAEVRQAAARADIVVRYGDAQLGPSSARGTWVWQVDGTAMGDWYAETGGGPLAAALQGVPLDSFAPLRALSDLSVPDDGWAVLNGRAGRRGGERPLVVAAETGGRRQVVVGASGFWRWAFRGGVSEQVYRAWVATTVDWLLGSRVAARGAVRPLQATVANGLPLVFAWNSAEAAAPLGITLTGEDGTARSDSLRFGPDGLARLHAPPGVYRYETAGGAGLVAVEDWSEEWFPRPVVLQSMEGRAPQAGESRTARDFRWLFALAVLALSGEWVVRRRRGLR